MNYVFKPEDTLPGAIFTLTSKSTKHFAVCHILEHDFPYVTYRWSSFYGTINFSELLKGWDRFSQDLEHFSPTYYEELYELYG